MWFYRSLIVPVVYVRTPVSSTNYGVQVTRKKSPPSFEELLSELEALVETMEKGELSLEDSLKSFERGVELTRSCQQVLKDAEQKVQILVGKDADAEPEDFRSNG